MWRADDGMMVRDGEEGAGGGQRSTSGVTGICAGLSRPHGS